MCLSGTVKTNLPLFVGHEGGLIINVSSNIDVHVCGKDNKSAMVSLVRSSKAAE